MTEQISFQKGVTLAGGAAIDRDDLRAALALAPHPVAADSGADRLAAYGTVPEAIIGDMDSFRGRAPDGARLIAVAEQDTTDFAKCLMRVDAPLFIGTGFLGGRLDHTLATLSVLLEYPEKRVVLLGEEDVAFLVPETWSVTLDVGARVSFFPLLPCLGMASSGLRWPIEGLEMVMGGQIGTSNEAIETSVSAGFDRIGTVAILPKRYLGQAVASLG